MTESSRIPPPPLPHRKSAKSLPLAQQRRNMLTRMGLVGGLLAAYIALFGFPHLWFSSGAPILTILMSIASSKGYRLPVVIPMAVNLAYAVASTSWLLYWIFAALCYPTILVFSIYRVGFVAKAVRKSLRKILQELQFSADKIAFFDLPALEIDTDVDGLMVVRGVTLSLSSLTIIVHGVEVGIKLSDDLELAIQTDEVVVRLFRSVHIDDVFANVKGGEYEMSFGHLADSTDDPEGDALMTSETPMLRAAANSSQTSLNNTMKMKNEMTDTANGNAPKDSSAKAGYDSMTKISPDDDHALQRYQDTIEEIRRTSKITESREAVRKRVRNISSDSSHGFDYRNENDMCAAICSELHETPSVAHPPRRSVKVTTLQNLSGPRTRAFLHRLPLLLRLLLNPLSYLHSIKIKSITAAGSGKWIQWMLQENLYKQYGENDGDIRRVEQRVGSWLSDANFAVGLRNIHAQAQVPFITDYDILAQLRFDDVMAYRTLPKTVELKQVVRLAGADADIAIPSFLLPHHEHILPPVPTKEDEEEQKRKIDETDSRPHEVHAENDLEQTRKDETNVKLSARIRLPAVFDQEVLDWTAALVKLSKLVEFEKDSSSPTEVKGMKESFKALQTSVRDGMKRVTVDAIANDRWIAKLVGKVTRKLETARGDIGYSGDIPVPLKPYRDRGEQPTKLLP